MNVRIIAVGKIKEPYLTQGLKEYSKRMGSYGRFEIKEIKEESFSEPLSAKELELILLREGERIISELRPRSLVIALDRLGQLWTSEKLAATMQKTALQGISHVDFIIGGSLGLHSNVLKKANHSLSFSKFTFPHQLMRLILIEQIYRAFTIIAGERYHK
ncbi:MAG: 23S rRNA (pseudouridine(1915)-N(3))-methyltransferase RlmH [Bacillota bacterium]|nr:23S rRNA (pseudouridine(1915)-N(3))-methyltransferase RlmH [Bacillota bacterium]HHU62277.1 23S rRNA (pseudouridine(1915)-N(3))-methyltransferase RlmH [Natronincola sp.]